MTDDGRPRKGGVSAGVHSLDHFAFSVPDLVEAEHFYASFGLEIRHRDGKLALHGSASDHCWAVIGEDVRKQIAHISFGAFADDMDRFRHALADWAIEPLPPQAQGDEGQIWFHDPQGLLVQIKASAKCSPDSKARIIEPHAASPLRGAPLREAVPQVRPARLSHILLFTPDIGQSVEFYTSALGLRLSDSSGPVAFLHGRHGSDHHVLAFAESSRGIGYHHSAWEVHSIADVGLGAMQMAAQGYDKGWGLGRHVLGSNYFHYVRDPWGSYAEFSCGIDYVPAGLDWKSTHPSPENSLYLWGPTPPEDFTTNYEG